MIVHPTARFLLNHPAHFLALGFGAGLVPVAPGTLGSLAAIPLFLLLPAWPLPWILALVALLFMLGAWCCGVTGRALGTADHGSMVWDEMVAMWLILALVPREIFWFAAAFALFRLFDIWKPFPVSWFDRRLKNGFGVMLDDLLAAGYALALLKGLQWLMTN